MNRPLHCDDIVVRKAKHTQQGVVDRTHGDIDSHQPYPGRTESDVLDHDRSISRADFQQFMKDGAPPKDTVLVRWQSHATLELMPISKLKLIDRSLLIGDIVKRNVSDAMSGVVLNTFTKCTLQPMCDVTFQNRWTIKGLLPPGEWEPGHDSQFCVMQEGRPPSLENVPARELTYAESPSEDDLVIYQDWVGRVEATTSLIRLQLADKCVVEVSEEVGESLDGSAGKFSIGDIMKTKKPSLRLGSWIFGQYNPNTPPVGTVVSIRTIGAEIIWLANRIGSDQEAPPNLLEVNELESADFQVYDRNSGPSSTGELSNTVSNSEPDIRLNLRVRFRDLPTAYGTNYRDSASYLDRAATYGYDINVFDVTSFQTDVTVQWQDLSITREKSIDVEPDTDIDDEHAAWPGEIAHSLNMLPVPNEHAEQPERVGVIQTVNAQDRLATISWSTNAIVYFSKAEADDEESGLLLRNTIPPATGESEELSLYDISTTAPLNVRRGDIVLVNQSPLNPALPSVGTPRDVSWMGEIVDTLLDGRLVIRLGASRTVRDVVLNREETFVAVRSDGTAPVDDFEGDEVDDDEYDDTDGSPSDVWTNGSESEVEVRYENENGDPMDEDEVENEDWESADEEPSNATEMFDANEQQPEPIEPQQPPPLATSPTEESHEPPSYLILEGDVPADHHFATTTPTEVSWHLKRTMKEHKILRTSSTLPFGVYIRTWSSRLDLLRIMLLGPTETPYAHCPFVFDIHLPWKFPQRPPLVFFHSWPPHSRIGGTGRVNPNLYEDGTVCLSLLGTWSSGGSGVEEWNAARSTLLQVVVSLLGLVLVREPYFNEAGYEGLVGLESSKRASVMYSERVGLRAKGFLISAVQELESRGLAGLEGLWDVVGWVYLDRRGPKLLEETIKDVEQTLERSREAGEEVDGLRVVSKGACTSLVRVLEILRGLQEDSRVRT